MEDEFDVNGNKSLHAMERELRSSIAKLYQNYDFVTDEYDRLFEIIDSIREEYNNCKNMFLYHRYVEFKRIIKNAIRKWRGVEKRSSLAISRKQSNTSYAMAVSGMQNRRLAQSPTGVSEASNFSGNLNARLRAQKDAATRDLYAECTRLEREIFQYKSKAQQIKNLLSKLAADYDNSKAHVLHIYGRYKEIRNMIKEIISADV